MPAAVGVRNRVHCIFQLGCVNPHWDKTVAGLKVGTTAWEINIVFDITSESRVVSKIDAGSGGIRGLQPQTLMRVLHIHRTLFHFNVVVVLPLSYTSASFGARWHSFRNIDSRGGTKLTFERPCVLDFSCSIS